MHLEDTVCYYPDVIWWHTYKLDYRKVSLPIFSPGEIFLLEYITKSMYVLYMYLYLFILLHVRVMMIN